MNLINLPFAENGNYLCTWTLQEKIAVQQDVPGGNIPEKQRNAMTDAMLFGEHSLYHVVPAKYRGGIYLLLDDGWDVPPNTNVNIPEQRDRFGSLILDGEKFAGYGDTPTERLKTLSDKVKSFGYAGLGLWVSPQIPFKTDASMDEHRAHWEERARWCQAAGVRYWKVDWGDMKCHFKRPYLQMMTETVRKFAPDLLIEHAVSQAPYKGTRGPDDPITAKMVENFCVSDFFRTYDVIAPFTDVETLCRLNALLCKTKKEDFILGARGYINIESSPAVAVGLSCNLGIMEGGGNIDAALSWQRVAPPMSIFDADYVHSDNLLTDEQYLEAYPAWWVRIRGEEKAVQAPAVSARGTRLPVVEPCDIPPYVMASCHHETKAYAVSTLKRVLDRNPQYVAATAVTIFPESITAPIGVFGYYTRLTAEFSETIPQNAKIFAQCLLEDEAVDVTEQVQIDGNRLILDGKLLRLWGRRVGSLLTDEDPALVLQIIK